ncbi:PAS domain S-box protein [Halorubrum sp. AD140]|uniref:hybrid sensor histidine kinase/response regulator n=1 Tax=Halorubrum sp. AD140 TaxID=3050073 RepID=UPI002ACCA40B|nr:PAS domain S-box protein [Halorubrum sp. AD140]MDZ5809846.1 PAS domain S-box protein [Halorubrum sp. AD140]
MDDDLAFAKLAATFLEREDPDLGVIHEPNGEAALETLDDETVSIDCVVSDYQMPEMDGMELLEAVRERSPTLPFILFTGRGSEEVAGRAISSGVTDYLQKEHGTDQYAVLANRIGNVVEQTRAEKKKWQLLTAIETAREGISLLDQEGRFTYVNSSYADAYGYDREELLGEHWEVLYPEDRLDRVYERLLPMIPDEGDVRERTVMERADGSEILVDHALSYTPDGTMVCNINTLSAERDRRGLLADVFDALDDLLFFFDEEGNLEFWNERVETVTGYTAAELSKRTPQDFVREADRDEVNRYLEATRENGTARVEVQLRREDGETIPYEFISKPVVNDGGDVIGRIGLGRDISERKRYERRFERQNERLEHFAQVLSHDLRNPVAIARGHFDLYRKRGNETHYETAMTAIDRMDSQITDILELAQTGDLIHASDYETTELETVSEHAWAMIRSEDATLEVAGTGEVEADASRLQQLLENLFRNAIEHGGSAVSVCVGLLPDEPGLYVEDDGPGIPPDQRDAVFDAGHSTKDGGTGFGLATVKQLVEAHDWEIRITTGTLGGARFEISGVEFAAED